MKKKYTIHYLLSKQPVTLKKNREYNFLIDYYNSSKELKSLRFNRKCYSLLNKAKVAPEKLNLFRRFFKLPQNPFFPLFLKFKKEYINDLNSKKKLKDQYIYNKMRLLPEYIRIYIHYFGKYEKSLNMKQSHYVWSKILYPNSKKKADIMNEYKKTDWIRLFFDFVRELKIHYNWIDETYGNKLVALFILELPIKKYSEEEIKRQYRILSKKYHPDTGGSQLEFNYLQKAKSIMIK